MRILVTGGGGFIGRATIKALHDNGHEAHSMDLSNGQDVRNSTDVHKALTGFDGVIHLAGVLGTHELFDTPYDAVESNIVGTLNVLEACKKMNLRYCGITMPQVFPSIYTATKVASTRLASAYHHTYGFPVAHVRAFNAFGPGQAHGAGHPQKIVPTFIVETLKGRPIPVWGDGSQGVDLIHTRDLGQMLATAVTRLGDREHLSSDIVLDGGTGRMFTVNEVAFMIARMCGMDGPNIQYKAMRRGERPTSIVALGEGWDYLGKQPIFRERDLEETVHWYMDRIGEYA